MDAAEEGLLDMTHATIIEKHQIQSSRDAATKRTFKTTEKVRKCSLIGLLELGGYRIGFSIAKTEEKQKLEPRI